MYNQSNAGNANHVADSKRPARKKKIGCLGCFGYSLLTILVLAVGLFAFNTIRSKIEEREQQKLEARFDYEENFPRKKNLSALLKKVKFLQILMFCSWHTACMMLKSLIRCINQIMMLIFRRMLLMRY